jgi:hypothetical protein
MPPRFWAQGNDDAGEAELRELCALHPNLYQPFYLLSLSQSLRGLHAEVLAAAENAYTLAPWNTGTTGVFAGALMRAGERRRAEELLQEPSAWRSLRDAFGLAGLFRDVLGNRAGGELGLEGPRAARPAVDLHCRAFAIPVFIWAR